MDTALDSRILAEKAYVWLLHYCSCRRDYTYAGTVEVSFNPRTRAKFLTLNPPAQNPYLYVHPP
jgi:hypothetical protein